MTNSVNSLRAAALIAAAAIVARTIALITRISGSPYPRCFQIALFLRAALPLCAPPLPRRAAPLLNSVGSFDLRFGAD